MGGRARDELARPGRLRLRLCALGLQQPPRGPGSKGPGGQDDSGWGRGPASGDVTRQTSSLRHTGSGACSGRNPRPSAASRTLGEGAPASPARTMESRAV